MVLFVSLSLKEDSQTYGNWLCIDAYVLPRTGKPLPFCLTNAKQSLNPSLHSRLFRLFRLPSDKTSQLFPSS